MRFEEAELVDPEEFVQTVRNVAIQHPYDRTPNVDVPLHIANFTEDTETHLPFGSDEPLSVSVEFPAPDDDWRVRYTFLGKIAARPIGPEVYHTERQIIKHDRAFDRWSGEWGGFLKSVVTVKEHEGRFYEFSETELALMETRDEFDQFGQTDGREVFELRPKIVDDRSQSYA